MSEDDSRLDHEPTEKHAEKPRRSWLDRISSALSGEPSSHEDLLELLRVQAEHLIEEQPDLAQLRRTADPLPIDQLLELGARLLRRAAGRHGRGVRRRQDLVLGG